MSPCSVGRVSTLSIYWQLHRLLYRPFSVLSKPTMKSITIFFHIHSGILRGYNNPVVFLLWAFSCWLTRHLLTNFAISFYSYSATRSAVLGLRTSCYRLDAERMVSCVLQSIFYFLILPQLAHIAVFHLETHHLMTWKSYPLVPLLADSVSYLDWGPLIQIQ